MKRILCLTLMLALVLSAVLAPTAALAASNYTVRTTASVNLRKGPGLGYGKITSLKSGKTLSYAGVSQFDSRGMGWHKVYYNGSTAWISWAYSNLQGDGNRHLRGARRARHRRLERAQRRGHELHEDHHRFQRHEHGLSGRNGHRGRHRVVQGDHLGGHRLGLRPLFPPGDDAGRQAGDGRERQLLLRLQLHQGLCLPAAPCGCAAARA